MKAAYLVYGWLGSVFLAVGAAALVQGPDLQAIRLIGLAGRPLPIVAGELHGTFAKYGVEVHLEMAPNSEILRASLADGKADIAHAAVDNAVAMVEMAGADVIIVLGGEGSLNELIAQPEIHSVKELRGRTLIVDATNTAYALQLKKILLLHGLQSGRDYELKPTGTTPQRFQDMREHKEYAGSMLGPPTSILAKQAGFVSLGSVRELIGPYQGSGAFVRRQWAREHADALVRYLAAYVETQRWVMAPVNKPQVIELLMKDSKLSAAVAEETYTLSVQGQGGYSEDARLDMKGFENVLKLRAEIEGQWAGRPPKARKYYDLSYYERALKKLKLQK